MKNIARIHDCYITQQHSINHFNELIRL